MIALKKKPKATKCSRYLTVSLVAHKATIVARKPRRRIARKIQNVLREDRLRFREGKGPRDATGMLRMSEWTLDKVKELCACFIDWQKVFEHVNWTKLMQILKVTDTNWCKRRLINQLYMDQSVKLKLDQAETRRVKSGRGVRQGCCLSPILLNLYGGYLNKDAHESFGDFIIGGQVIHTVKYAVDLVLLAKKEVLLQGMIERLIEIGRCCVLEINVEKTKVVGISRQPSPITDYDRGNQPEIVEYFNCLVSKIAISARCTWEIKSRIAMAKVAFSNKKAVFTSRLDLNLRKNLVKCYIWSIALYGAEFGHWIRNTRTVLKCGAGEGGRRLVGLIMWEMNKC